MKILVCTDGSKYSWRALEEASVIAKGCTASEVAVIHVYSQAQVMPFATEGFTGNQMEGFQKMRDEFKKEKRDILLDAEKFFAGKNIKARIILKEGHASDMIVKTIHEGSFDLIVMGGRGLGGLKKMFLGSISNAVLQEVKNCNVLIVK